jgi:hypothetical protein
VSDLKKYKEILVSKLIPVIYRNMKYPSPIKAYIHEISGNFYKEKLIVRSPYSLHTEPSSVPRTFNSKIVNELEHIKKRKEIIYRNYGIIKNGQMNFIYLLIG